MLLKILMGRVLNLWASFGDVVIFRIFKDLFLLMCMTILPMCVDVQCACVWAAEAKKTLGSLELKFWMAVSHCVVNARASIPPAPQL